MAENIAHAESSLATKLIKYWLPVLTALGLMYYFSTDLFSGDNTRGVVRSLLHWLVPDASEKTAIKINYLVRKSMHFIEYGLLAALVFRAFRADSPRSYRARWAAYSLVIVVGWALIDEYHQSLTRTRGGSVTDVLIDSAGGLCALLLISLLSIRKGRGPV